MNNGLTLEEALGILFQELFFFLPPMKISPVQKVFVYKANVNTVGMEMHRHRFCNSQTLPKHETEEHFLSSMLLA